MNLPAGLSDTRIEFFSDPGDRNVCFAITCSIICRVRELPDRLKSMIWDDTRIHHRKTRILIGLGYTGDALLERYCSCCFGMFDFEADYSDGKFNHHEFVPYEFRDICPDNNVLWGPLIVGDGQALTSRETSVLKLVGNCLLNKEIASDLRISEETVKKHIKNIQLKSNLQNKKDMVKLAHQKNLN